MVVLAGTVAAVAVFDAFLGFVMQWLSARVGESLVYDLRTQVFRHVQRQPIAFFTRAQTGSLVSRLNSNVIGAQQAVTSVTAGVVSNGLSLLTLLAARQVARRLQRLTGESTQLDAAIGSTSRSSDDRAV